MLTIHTILTSAPDRPTARLMQQPALRCHSNDRDVITASIHPSIDEVQRVDIS